MIDLPWNFPAIPLYFPRFFQAALMTLQITAGGIILGFFLGLITALMRMSKYKIFSVPTKFYIWGVRGTPLLLQLLIIYYGLSDIIDIPRFPAAIIALGIHNGAYIAVIFRGAIESIDRGQKEAALTLGMTNMQVMRRIILPQAFKLSIPPLGNQFIIAMKDSSLASTIAVHELLLRARQLGNSTFMMLEMLAVAGIYYLIMTTIFTFLVGKIETRLQVSEYRE